MHWREAQVGLVAAVSLHGLVVANTWKRTLDRVAGDAPKPLHQRLDDLEDHRKLGIGHLKVNLGKLRLSICAQVLVAEAARDLEIAVEPRDHQNLLEQLRRLRQRIKRSLLHAARNEIVARAFRCRARQKRRLDFEKALLTHAAADL